MKNYYQILEVPSDASQDAIKEQYFFLMQAWHPDKFPNPTQKIKAEEKTKEINAAYAVLSNPIKRAEYDNSIGFSGTDQKQEHNRQKKSQATQRQAEDERRKREEEARQAKEEQLRKERADRERGNAERHHSSTITTSEVIKAWEQIASAARIIHGRVVLNLLLNTVDSIVVQEGTLVLAFAREGEKSAMTPKYIEITRQIVFDILGVTLDVRCITVEEQLRKERADKERVNAERHHLSTITASEVIKAWKQITSEVFAIRAAGNVGALLNSVKTIDLQGGTLVLYFASEIVKSKMTPEGLELTRQIIFDVLGVNLDVICTVVKKPQ